MTKIKRCSFYASQCIWGKLLLYEMKFEFIAGVANVIIRNHHIKEVRFHTWSKFGTVEGGCFGLD